ncbi:ADP-glucose phosphorylase [Macadamia integrifolia]|uniref:ADP-glucose phosphorylase n=1 Tax=Macadamia integrifolia TaxID=60698 RepID=UPI001C4E54BA|nr:ADP-glucose phosphorylase [Macadamia integrifolia]XP_042513572.1 ADP-glucose phosphorylase [Macadamia integrifolia]
MASSRNPEIRKDTVFNRWVIFSPARAKRPSDFKSKSPANPNNNASKCPFCAGNEHECAPEIFRIPRDFTSDWKIRVIENLYPALSRDERQQQQLQNPKPNAHNQCTLSGFGFHDVVIETPTHTVQLFDLSATEIGEVLLAYKERIKQLECHESIKYVQVFKNYGASAGASLSHSHSQIIALPIIPPSVSIRLDSMKEYFDRTGKCSLCEIQPEELLIKQSTHFISVVPFAASFPFEIWIIPNDHLSHFHELDDEKTVDFGGLLKLMLLKLSRQLNDPPFNFMIHTSPLHAGVSQLPYSHWFLQIVPQLTTSAGFEMATGCNINPVFPEDAAKVLREVNVLM